MFPKLLLGRRDAAKRPMPSAVLGDGRLEYLQLLRVMSTKLAIKDVEVVGHYSVLMPGAQEGLQMPAVSLAGHGSMVALKWDFSLPPPRAHQWTLSVRRTQPYSGPTLGLFDPELDLRNPPREGLAPSWCFGPYRENPAEFTCEVEDAWDVMTLLRLVFHLPLNQGLLGGV